MYNHYLRLYLSEDAHIDQNQFNWLGTIFYIFFLVFEYPQSFALQRLPVGRWLRCVRLIHVDLLFAHGSCFGCSLNVFVWSVALLCHSAATNFSGLFVCRAFLGICEGAITPGFMIITSMFYTRQEQTQRIGYWCESIFLMIANFAIDIVFA